MKLVSYNINGIRAAIKKGFIDWVASYNPAILCLQEVKALEEQVGLQPFIDLGYNIYWNAAQKKGYSGVAVLTKEVPISVTLGGGEEIFDCEGRIITLEFQNFTLINAYIPSGTNSARQGFKMDFLAFFEAYCAKVLKANKKLVICGDFNICHKAIDIHNPIANKNSSGFLPEERAWVDSFLELGFLDTFRLYHPQPHQYSWWTYRANARNNNKGWRIDYWMASHTLKTQIKEASILPDVRHSDHCPVAVCLTDA